MTDKPTLDELIEWADTEDGVSRPDAFSDFVYWNECSAALHRLQHLELVLRDAKLEFVIAAEEFDHRAASSKLSQCANAAEAWIKSAAKMRSLAALQSTPQLAKNEGEKHE